ncbi:Taurine catabolism dioxygenase TauD/TfdA [Macrophomina phaseolina MS6]|uniref:Taurine catabolism dioxygenase TauD/TfdA n=1 Tax=Macrophomina phaseolina (strain MS6) TaxID=1126212 RepID=K2SSP4_MACPH|nr:Taurine catabolism dioxygenase TauD/TfdA [Macrophomina phaseolina MS6]
MKVYDGERGAPENVGLDFKLSQPMVRTHPVTGWKTLFAGGLHCRRVDGVSDIESQELLAKILRLVSDNHDLQVRFRWNTANDIGKQLRPLCNLAATNLHLLFQAIWDNRCVLHCPTQDHYGLGPRGGFRTMSIAEKPYLDPSSPSRRAALAVPKKAH